jgi:2-polyprenyl-6-methoxyphenol hydroxylase-like FAD-dependent oxidoreductase
MRDEVDVVIVGAGPTGLTLACIFSRMGISYELVELKEKLSEHSKALAVQARTLELFEKFGIAEEAIRRGQKAHGLDYRTHGRLRAKLNLSQFGEGLTRYPYLLILEQDKTEQLLYESLVSAGGRVNFGQECVDFSQEPQGSFQVKLRSTSDSSERVVKTRYLLGADGARSLVRHKLGLAFEGGTYESRFVLCDVKVEGPIDHERLTIAFSASGMAGFFPMEGEGRFRVFGPVPDELARELEGKMDFERVAQRLCVDAGFELKIYDPKWTSVYRIHHRCVEEFRRGSCFVVGDAAHVHSPVGAQGMNTGIQDAFNLAWKIAYVLKGWARDELLSSYQSERKPFALRLVQSTDRAFKFATSHGLRARWLRLKLMPWLLPRLLSYKRTREFIFRTVSQIGIHYNGSPLNAQYGIGDLWPAQAPKPGDRIPDVRLRDGRSLSELTRELAFHLVVIEAQSDDAITGYLEKLIAQKPWIRVHRLPRRELVDADAFVPQDDSSAYLIRPDAYLAFRATPFRVQEFTDYLELL